MLNTRWVELSQLPQIAQEWNDLWARSTSRHPVQRAESIELWCQTFATNDVFTALVVEQDERLVGALPLLRTRHHGIPVLQNTWNPSVNAGHAMIDRTSDVQAIATRLVNAVLEEPGWVAVFDGIEIDDPAWDAILTAFADQGCALHVGRPTNVGVIDIPSPRPCGDDALRSAVFSDAQLGDWETYSASWSRNHRSAIKRSMKKLHAEGEVEVQRMQTPDDQTLYETLETCFLIEDKTWKGEQGTSILKVPGMRQYYHSEARLIRDAGMLDLWLLKLNGRVIAFEYCHFAKSICLSHKISFDPEFERFSPGRVLRAYQLQAYHADDRARLLDTLGILCSAKAKWCTRTYRTSRCIVATSPWAGNALIQGIKVGRSLRGILKRNPVDPEEHQPGAARYLESAQARPDLAVPTVNLGLSLGAGNAMDAGNPIVSR